MKTWSPGLAIVAERAGDPGWRDPDDARRRLESGVDRAPDGQQDDADQDDQRGDDDVQLRMTGVPSGSGWAGSLMRLVTSTPAIAATAPSGHHATPRTANAPMTKKTPSQASVGHGRPAAAPGDEDDDGHRRPEEQQPGHVVERGRLPLGDASVTEAVGRQPERVDPDRRAERRHARGRDGDDGHEQRPVRVRHVVVDVLEPGETQHDRPEEEAAVDVGPDEDDERDRPEPARMGAPIGDEDQHDREQGHPDELRPKRERHRGDDERDEGRAEPRPGPPARAAGR